jgi:HlyD family secretion protein
MFMSTPAALLLVAPMLVAGLRRGVAHAQCGAAAPGRFLPGRPDIDGAQVRASAGRETVRIEPAAMPTTPARTVLDLLRRHARLAAVLLVALLVAVPAGWRLLRGPEVVVTPVAKRDFVQTIVASGRVEAPHRVALGVQITGTVHRVVAEEGQRVEQGAALIELESAELRAALAQAEVAVQQAAARLRQLREVQAPVAEQAVALAQANQGAAQQALARSRELFSKGFIGQAALDEAQRAERVAQAQLDGARRQRDGALPTGSDTAVATTALAQARAGAEAARARLQYTTVRAPAAGTVITRGVEPGDVVQPGKALLVLSPAGETQLVVQIDEKNLRLLQPGQPALVSADAFAQQRFVAEVVSIDPAVDAQRGSIDVKLRVPAPPAYLRQDMTVSVDIEVARRPGATLVPVDAVHELGAASPWLLKVEGGRVRRQALRLGLVSSGWCEVLGGVREGELIVPRASPTLADGARVRPLVADSASVRTPAAGPQP